MFTSIDEVLRRPIEFTLRPLVAVDDGVAVRSLIDGHAQCIGDERSTRPRVDRPADHPARPGVEDHRAVHLALSRRMLGDIGDPQLIRLVAMKLSLDAVAGGGDARDVTITRAPRNAVDARSAH